MDEGGVADDRDHATRLVGRQDVTQAQAHADRGAHGHAGVHRLVRRQHAERVAADVAGHDAVVLLERGVDGVVRAGRAELRRLAARRGRFGRVVAGQDAPDTRHVQLTEAVHLGLRLDGDAGGAQRVGDDRIALLDHDAALDGGGEGAR